MILQASLTGIVTLALGTVMSVQGQALPADARLDLFLLAGQSNMAGRGKVGPDDKVPDPHVWMLTQARQWAPAIDPIHFDKPDLAGVGPGRTFGIVIAQSQTNVQVGLVPCAFGGTSIDEWKKGGKFYTDAIERAKAAMARGTFKAILWHQGESDLGKGDLTGYLAKLHTLIADFRADLNSPELPFIVGQLGRFHREGATGIDAFNAGLVEFAAKEPHCACVTSEGLVSRGDELHFDTPSQHELGRRYAAAYLKLIGTPQSGR
jgi:hypothetical protein